MEKLYCLIRVAFQTKFAYIKAFWFNIFGTAVSILIYYFLWKYVFMSREELHGFTAVQMTTYVVLSRTLSSQFSGGINKEFAEWVYKGNIVVELLRPIHLAFNLFGKRLGEFFFFLLFKGIPIGILGTLLLGGCGPAGVVEFLLFFVSVLVSIGILFWIEVAVGIVSFFTLNTYGLAFTKSALLSILSGGVVPLFLFPESVARVLDYLPFAGMVTVPVYTYLGKYSIQEAVSFIGLQVVWCVLLGVLVMAFYQKAIKKVVVQGGRITKMKRVSYCLRLWRAYLRVGFLTMTQYPADTVILLISMLVREASGFVGILAIVGVTGGMGNWNVYEVCILFSMCAVIEAIGQAFFDNVWGMDHMMRRGELDVFLTRPAPVFLQVLGQVTHFQAVFRRFYP